MSGPRRRVARRDAHPSSAAPPLAAPRDVEAHRVMIGGEEFVLLEWPGAATALPDGLTAAEREIVALVLAGLTNAEIARRRGSAPRTVANQLASVFGKLGVGSRHELVARLGAGPKTG